MQHFFNATELKSTPERIIENTSDDGYYLDNIDTTDSYRIGLFRYNIRQGSVANKRVGRCFGDITPYKTEEEAKTNIGDPKNYIATVPIEWEE